MLKIESDNLGPDSYRLNKLVTGVYARVGQLCITEWFKLAGCQLPKTHYMPPVLEFADPTQAHLHPQYWPEVVTHAPPSHLSSFALQIAHWKLTDSACSPREALSITWMKEPTISSYWQHWIQFRPIVCLLVSWLEHWPGTWEIWTLGSFHSNVIWSQIWPFWGSDY